jgi:hypothetical protein
MREDIARYNEDDKTNPPKMDLFWDFKEVWGSFISAYGIDLYTEQNLHWWGFMSLLHGLGPDTPLGRLIQCRENDGKKKVDNRTLIAAKLAAIPVSSF